MQTKSNMIEVDSAKHTDAHSRGIICAYWAAPSAVAARYLMHLSMDGCRSCRETLSAALLRGCYRTARAQLDLPRTPAISGHHQQRVVRPAALEQRAHSLRATVASLRRWLRYAGQASTCTFKKPFHAPIRFWTFNPFPQMRFTVKQCEYLEF